MLTSLEWFTCLLYLFGTAQVPGIETLTEDIDEFQSASQVAASVSTFLYG